MITFKQFIREGAGQLRPLTAAEFLKYEWRVSLFVKKFKAKEKFQLVDSTYATFKYDPSVVKDIESGEQSKMNNIRLMGTDGKEYRLSSLGKNKEFGGRGAGSGTAIEDMELKSVRDQLNDIKTSLASATIPIRVKNKVYDVFDVVSTPGTPKSDFHFVDIDGKEIIWISHKAGKKPNDFQQWGGTSARVEPLIAKHKEVHDFINDIKTKYPNGLPPKTTLFRKIKDTKLKNIAVYGNDYGKQLGRQNVSVLLQGPVNLKKSGTAYEFVSNHVHYNGDAITGGFEPVLTAIYKGDRSDHGVKGTRIVIMALEGRKMTGAI